jgi:hypothetical protein
MRAKYMVKLLPEIAICGGNAVCTDYRYQECVDFTVDGIWTDGADLSCSFATDNDHLRGPERPQVKIEDFWKRVLPC